MDETTYSVRLTLWGKQAEQFIAEAQAVAAFKGVKVGDFGGRSLSMVSGSTMTINPDIPAAHFLRGWYVTKQNCKILLNSIFLGMTVKEILSNSSPTTIISILAAAQLRSTVTMLSRLVMSKRIGSVKMIGLTISRHERL